MLFKVAFVLLAVWLLGAIGLFEIGEFVHGFLLLIGLMLLLLGFVRGRDAARKAPGHSDKP